MNVDFDDQWVTSIYENCATAMESLQAKEMEEELNHEEQGLSNICEVVVYLYNEVYNDPSYIKNNKTTKVLH